MTRSGTNTLDGSIFGTKRNKSFVGNGPTDTPVSQFSQTQYGGRIGGPIVHDRAFFFVSGERNRKDTPLGITGSTTRAAEPETSRFSGTSPTT